MTADEGLWGRVKAWASRNATQLTVVSLPAGGGGGAPLVAQQSYFRLWLSDVFLKRDRDWFRNRYPAVHASIQLQLAGRERVTFTRVVRPPEGMLGPGPRLNTPLSELLPFSGGVVELEAGLSALQGDSTLGATIEVLQGFSSLISPPLASAVPIAGMIASGVERILKASKGDLELGFHQAFTSAGGGGSELRAGHTAIVLASHDELADAGLCVVDERLCAGGNPTPKPLTGYDYMLFRVEGRTERDDWRFPQFDELINGTIDALRKGDDVEFDAQRKATLAMILKSPDLTVPDRRRVAKAVNEEILAARELGLGLVPEKHTTLEEIVQARAPSLAEVRGLPPATLSEMLADT